MSMIVNTQELFYIAKQNDLVIDKFIFTVSNLTDVTCSDNDYPVINTKRIENVGITDQDLVDFNILPPLTEMDRFITEYQPTPTIDIDDMLNWLKENSKGTNFTTKVQKLGFHVDGVYYTALCSLKQLNSVSHNIPIYKDGNRLGKKKTYNVLKRRNDIIQNRLKSIQDGTAEYLTDEDFKELINKRKGE